MIPGLVSSERFIPHSYQNLVDTRALPPGALPEPVYTKLIRDYDSIDDVTLWRIVYNSDGLQVTGLLCLPAQVKDAAHSLLVYNRGGNREFGKLTLLAGLRAMVPYARKGYLVYASNYRGNDGGEGREEFGGADVQDVLNLLAIGKLHPAFDGKNAYMIGHSRGGMMTYLAIRHGAAINAAISIAGVSDIAQSGMERPDVDKNVLRHLIPGAESDREAAYRERSALCWPEALTVPLLLLHGDADDRVDVSHSRKLAAALDTLQLPHALHIYPGGNHALLRVWDDVLQRSLAWLEAYKT